jgi:2Fe-2S ferredoxin
VISVAMATVRVEPDGHDIAVDEDESLIEAAWRQGYNWPTTCFGQARCTACRVEVVSGEEHLTPPTGDEAEALAMIPHRGRSVRLACRLRATGDVVVSKHGVEAPDGRVGEA